LAGPFGEGAEQAHPRVPDASWIAQIHLARERVLVQEHSRRIEYSRETSIIVMRLIIFVNNMDSPKIALKKGKKSPATSRKE